MFALRFLDLRNNASHQIKEVFFDFVNLDKTSGESTANDLLSSWPRTTSMSPFARGRAHDHGTAAMSSVACSVRGRKKRIAPMALYTNYNGHVLNLSVAAARRLTPVTEI